jgi:hypothetical protein
MEPHLENNLPISAHVVTIIRREGEKKRLKFSSFALKDNKSQVLAL